MDEQKPSWWNPSDPQRISPRRRWVIKRAKHGQIYIPPSMLKCAADRYAQRQHETGRRRKYIQKLRQLKRTQSTKKAIEQEMKTVADGQQVASLAGEARTMNPMKAMRKALDIRGRKASKLFRKLWRPDMTTEDFHKLAMEAGIL